MNKLALALVLSVLFSTRAFAQVSAYFVTYSLIVAQSGPSTQATLATTITTSSTSITLSSGSGYPAATVNSPVALILSNSNNNNELITCTAYTSPTYSSCSRGVMNTTAQAWTASSPATTVSLVSFALVGESGAPWPILQMWNGPTWLMPGPNFTPANAGNLFGTHETISADNPISLGDLQFTNSSAGIQPFSSGSGYGVNFNSSTRFIDGDGITSGVNGTQAITSGTTSLTPASGVLVLTGTAPTSGGLLTIVPASTAASCSVTNNVSCEITIINTTNGSITTGSGTAANDFAAAYTLPAKQSMKCTGYGTTNLWYCD